MRDLSERFGLAVRPEARIDSISVGMQQRVEILKALYRGAEILILDEPTAVLTPQEAEELFAIVRSLQAEGKSIIFISHKLNEVLADRRPDHGAPAWEDRSRRFPRAGATEEGLAQLMVGREVVLRVEKKPAAAGRAAPDRRGPARRSTSAASRPCAASRFEVRAGEIVGIAGVDGNGQSELIDALTGCASRSRDGSPSGGKDVTNAGRARVPRQRRRPHPRGPPAPRARARLLARREPRPPRLPEPPDSKWGWLFPSRLVDRARRLLKEFDVRGGGPQTPAAALSGGNQQKVVVAREVSRDPGVLVAAQPTRGLDVGAIEFVHRRLVTERDEGRGDPARLVRARRDPLALRPDPRRLRGPDRRRSTRATSRRRSSASR